MDGDALHSIGDLARRTGLTVKTIRFYSDRGIVPPAGRSPAGHRLYGIAAVARLDLVRTLRDLGLDLPTIQRVLDREVSLAQVAAAHAEALTVQIRTLRLRRAVLTAVARHGPTPKEMDLMHRLAALSEEERREMVDDFLDAVFGGLEVDHGFAGIRRSMTPRLPDEPETEQVEAWIELAELSRDPGFRDGMRQVARDHAAERAENGGPGVRRDLAAVVRECAGRAVASGTDPASPEAGRVVADLTARYADVVGRPDDDELLRSMSARLEHMVDPRRERYSHLLAVINGWQAPESLAPVLDWSVRAVRARIRPPAPDRVG